MLIGVTGDTHNNLKNISKICDIFNEIRPSLVIHTGDITLPKSLLAFSKLNVPFLGVFGNNDQLEKNDLLVATKKFDCQLFDEPYILKKSSIKICILHHPDLIKEDMFKNYDFIIHGHTHRYRSEVKENCIIFNPGECAGFLKGRNNIGLIDTEKKLTKIISF